MSKNCEQKNPSVRIRLHTPKQLLHGHNDKTIELKGETDFEVWHNATIAILEGLGYTHPRLQVGFFWDLLNQFPPDVRTMLITGIAQGLGLEVKEVPGEDGKTAAQVSEIQRYQPLVKAQRKDGLVLPGNKDFKTSGVVKG